MRTRKKRTFRRPTESIRNRKGGRRKRERSDIGAPKRIRPGTRTGNNPACMAATGRRKWIFGKRLTAVTSQLRDLVQPAGCTNTTWEEDQFPSLRHRDSTHGRRRIRRTSSPIKRPVDVFPDGLPVVSTAFGLVYLEPKAAIKQRHRVRIANGVADIQTNERFASKISIFSKTPKFVPKGTVE